MANKPSTDTVLRFYSLDELLGLVKEKARMDVSEKLQAAKNHLLALTGALGGGVSSAPAEIGTPRKGRRGRPPKAEKQTAAVKTAGRRGRPPKAAGKNAKNSGGESLSSLLMDVLDKTPKGIEDLMNDLSKQGWNSKSKDPRRVLYLELGKQVKKGTIQKSSRGQYMKG